MRVPVCHVFFFMLLCPLLHGQFAMGLKASYLLPLSRSEEIKYDDALDFLTYKIRFIEEDISPTLAAFFIFENDLVFARADLSYRKTTTRFSAENFISFPIQISLENKETHFIQTYTTAGLKLNQFRFGAGPYFSWIVSENTIFKNIDNLNENRRSLNPGFQIYAALAINRLWIELAYEHQFSGVADYLYYRGRRNGFNGRSQYISISLGYKIFDLSQPNRYR